MHRAFGPSTILLVGDCYNVHFMDENTEARRGQLAPTSQLQAVEAGFKPGSWTAKFTLYLQK